MAHHSLTSAAAANTGPMFSVASTQASKDLNLDKFTSERTQARTTSFLFECCLITEISAFKELTPLLSGRGEGEEREEREEREEELSSSLEWDWDWAAAED